MNMKYIIMLTALLTALTVNASEYGSPLDMDDNTGDGVYFLEPIADHSNPPAYFMRANNQPIRIAMSTNQKILMWNPYSWETYEVGDDTPYLEIEGGLYSGDFVIPTTIVIYDQGIPELAGPVTTISMGTFAKCHDLTSVTLPGSLQQIRRGAFYDCTALTEVKFQTFPYVLSEVMIYPHAFRGCTSLRKMDLRFAGQPRSPYGKIFLDCPDLEEVILRADIKDVHMNLGRRTYPSIKKITLVSPDVYSQKYTEEAFFPEEYENAVVIVPDGCKDKYSQVYPWNKFAHMMTTSEVAGLDEITDETELVNMESGILTLIDHDLSVDVYDPTGRKVCVLSAANPGFSPDGPGVYLLHSSGGAQKVLIR